MNQNDTAMVAAGAYFAAEDKYGSAAWSEPEIEESSALARSRLDEILVAALPIGSVPLSGGLASSACRLVQAGTLESADVVSLPSRRFTFEPEKSVFLLVGRYGDGATTGAAAAESGVTTLVRVPRDSSDKPWRIGFFGGGEVRVCASAAEK